MLEHKNATLNKGPFSLLLFFQNSFFPEFLKVGNSPWKRDPEILIAQLDTSLHIQICISQQRTGHLSWVVQLKQQKIRVREIQVD